MKGRIAFILVLPLLMSACGGGSNSSSAADPPGPLSGNWQVALISTISVSDPHQETGFLQQDGNAITGSVIVLDNPCSGIGSVTGTVSGSDVTLSASPTGSVVTLTGSINSGQTSMGGNYTISSSGCTAAGIVPDSGSWTANLVAPLNGNIQGTMTSQSLGTFTVSGQLTQGPNTGISTATLSGTINISPGFCFSTADIVGTISGTGVIINLVDSDGTQIGQIAATTTLDGTNVSGKLNFVGEGSTGAKGCREDLGAPISFTL